MGGGGVPTLAGGVPTLTGYPLPPGVYRQTPVKTVPSRHTAHAGGNDSCVYTEAEGFILEMQLTFVRLSGSLQLMEIIAHIMNEFKQDFTFYSIGKKLRADFLCHFPIMPFDFPFISHLDLT